MNDAISMTATTKSGVADILKELSRQAETRRDYIAPAKDLSLEVPEDRVMAVLDLGKPVGRLILEVGEKAGRQFSDKLHIPQQYYRRMAEEAPHLLAENVNHWLRESERNFLLRTLDGRLRACLSDRYRTLDSSDLCFTAAAVGKDVGAEITRVDLTETRFYMRLIHPEWRERIDEQRKSGTTRNDGGDWVIPGCIVSNSEVGEGGLRVDPFLFYEICSNGQVGDSRLFKVHLGRQNEIGALSEETKAHDDEGLWMKVRDLIKATFDRERFQAWIADVRETTTMKLEHPIVAVDNVVAHFGMSDEDKQAILDELVSPSNGRDPGRTVYGMIQAVTARAHAYENANDAITFERAGEVLVRRPGMVTQDPERSAR